MEYCTEMAIETATANEGKISGIQIIGDESVNCSCNGDVIHPVETQPIQPLSDYHNDQTDVEIVDQTQNGENGATKSNEDRDLQELLNMDTTSSTTISLLAATYSSSDKTKNDKSIPCVTLDDDSPSTSVSPKVSMGFNAASNAKYRQRGKKTLRREQLRLAARKNHEKREQLKREAKQRMELGLDIIEETVSSPQIPKKNPQPICASESDGYVKSGYRLRNAKRPPNYEAQTLQEWSEMREEERAERELQKLIQFKEEQIITELRRRKNNRTKILNEKAAKNDATLARAENFLNEISQSNTESKNKKRNNDDVKIVKVVKPKPKKKITSKLPSSKLSKYSTKNRRISEVVLPVSPFPLPPPRRPITYFPASSIRRPQLHTISSLTPRPPIIRFLSPVVKPVNKPPVSFQSKISRFTDDCFTFVPCSTSSTSKSTNTTTTATTSSPAPSFYSKNSKRVQLKKQAAYLNSLVDDQEPVFDECFSTVPCPTSSTSSTAKPSILHHQSVSSKCSPVTARTTVSSTKAVASSAADDCFTSVPCSPSIINSNTVPIIPPPSTLTVPLTSQPALISQFSTIAATATTTTATITAPLQMSSQQVQTITIPSSMLPPPGTPLQIVFVLPNAPQNNNNTSSPIILQQPPPISSSSSMDDVKAVVNVKCEIND